MNESQLTPIKFKHKNKWGHQFWLYKCVCGSEKIINKSNVDFRTTNSCGCLRKKKREKIQDSRLLLLGSAPRDKWGNARNVYQCLCGITKVIRESSVTSGITKSCGCMQREHIKLINSTKIVLHGEASQGTTTKEYRCWQGMKWRCTNPNNREFKNYGGRGIKVYKSWISNYTAFRDYLLLTIGRCPGSNYSLDRINVNGNYEPGNLRWATKKQQANNRRLVSKLYISDKEEIELILKFRQEKLKCNL